MHACQCLYKYCQGLDLCTVKSANHNYYCMTILSRNTSLFLEWLYLLIIFMQETSHEYPRTCSGPHERFSVGSLCHVPYCWLHHWGPWLVWGYVRPCAILLPGVFCVDHGRVYLSLSQIGDCAGVVFIHIQIHTQISYTSVA